MNFLIISEELYKEISNKTVQVLDFVFIRKANKKYDVLKNRFNGENYKNICYEDCIRLVERAEKFRNEPVPGVDTGQPAKL